LYIPKQTCAVLGLGIALAVLMAAMIVRSLLVPAVMRLTGRATWWAPAPLRRLHARFGLSEGGEEYPPGGAGLHASAAPPRGATCHDGPADSDTGGDGDGTADAGSGVRAVRGGG
jgi:RND superfamily putative drug exporter